MQVSLHASGSWCRQLSARGSSDGRSGQRPPTLGAACTFDVLLRNGQTWRGVRLVELDSWSLLLDGPEQGRVLLAKHAVDA